MNKNTVGIIIGNIIIVLIFTVSYVVIWGYSDLTQAATVFLITFGAILIFSYFGDRMKITPITKEIDEILHPVTQIENTLHISNIKKHFGKQFDMKLVEKCSCGSTLFRIYHEDSDKGTYIQFICARCNIKATGVEFNWKEVKN